MIRSLLFTPANDPRKVQRVSDFGADAAVLDLEDAVAESEKSAARKNLRSSLSNLHGLQRCVRVNALPTGATFLDIEAAVCDQLDLLVLPMVDGPEHLSIVDAFLRAQEASAGIPKDSITLLPLIETAKGVSNVDEIARSAPDRVKQLAFGLGDYATETRLDISAAGTELLYARSRIVNASAAASLAPPLDGPYLNIKDDTGLNKDSTLSKQLGFAGRVVVYPGQVTTVNQAYSEINAAALQRAEKIVHAFERAEANGVASIQLDGEFIDYPIYYKALQTLNSAHSERD